MITPDNVTAGYMQTAHTTNHHDMLRYLKNRAHAFHIKHAFNGGKTIDLDTWVTDGTWLLSVGDIKPGRLQPLKNKDNNMGRTISNFDCEQIIHDNYHIHEQPLRLAGIHMRPGNISHAALLLDQTERTMHVDVYKLGYILSVLKTPCTLHAQNIKGFHLKGLVIKAAAADDIIGLLMPVRIDDNSSPKQKPPGPAKTGSKKMNALLDSCAMNLDTYMLSAITDSMAMCICTNTGCSYTTTGETDMAAGICEQCGTKTVKSGLILMGTI